MKYLIFVALSLLLLVFVSHQPKIYLCTDSSTLFVADYHENLPVTINFTHSVQKTPVIEELVLQNGEFVLIRTKYKSFGVGLPFDADFDGNFYQDGDFFVMDDMFRHFKQIELRTGKGTQLSISIDGKIFYLYKKFPPGTKIIVKTF